jgi:Cu/Ag efflux protein CusF
MRMVTRIAFVAIVATGIGVAASSAIAYDEHAPGTEPVHAALARATAWIDGEVREVDRDEGSLVLGHGRITRWRMEAMSSMVFSAREPALLANLKPGDKVSLRAAMRGRQPVVTQLKPVTR